MLKESVRCPDAVSRHERHRRETEREKTTSPWLVAAFALVAATAFGAAPAQQRPQIPAFPGAQGWGSTTPGGRNGKIVLVTSLADHGPGTLREALETPGPRTILFRVCGVIRLERALSLGGSWNPEQGDNPFSFVTIAGQSAPGGGITITGHDFVITNAVHDVVIRHLRFRAAGEGVGANREVRRLVLDHCSMSWGYDENCDLFHNVTDTTVSYCIIAEGLANGGHPKGMHSCGMLVSKGADRISVRHNFFTGNDSRNPLFTGGDIRKWRGSFVLYPCFDFRNNLIYNCRWQTALRIGPQINVVGNVYVNGPSTLPQSPQVSLLDLSNEERSNEGTRVYVRDNVGPHLPADGDPWSIVYDEIKRVRGPRPEVFRLPKPIPAPPVDTAPSGDVAELVLREAGAQPRDQTDLRLVREFREKKGASGAPDRTRQTPFPPPAQGTPPADADDDGMPDEWEARHHLDPEDHSDCWLDADKDGYGNAEEYLNGTDPHKADR